MTVPTLVNLGYEGRSQDEVLAVLQERSVDALVDVRLTPLSRKPGLSKRRLEAALRDVGIAYVHARALGNPKDNREGFRRGEPESREHFRTCLRSEAAVDAIQQISELLGDATVALLCFERDHRRCHRQLVVEAVRTTRPRLAVVSV